MIGFFVYPLKQNEVNPINKRVSFEKRRWKYLFLFGKGLECNGKWINLFYE